MATVVRMPSVLAGATEAALAHWLVSPGDSVSAGTPIAELETEKALVEYAAEEAGVVGRLLVGEGDAIAVGDPIAILVGPGETDADIDAALGGSGPGAPSGSSPAAGLRPTPTVPAAAAQAESAGGAAPANGHQAGRGVRVFASPLVRKRAGERGIDLAGLAGTGPNGRIVRRDLERFLATLPAGTAPAGTAPADTVAADTAADTAAADTAAADTAAGAARGGEAEHATVLADAGAARAAVSSAAAPAGATLIPHTPMRRAIARRLSESKATVPHFYLTAECVVDELLALRGRVNATPPGGVAPGRAVSGGVAPGRAVSAGAGPVKVSVNDFVLAAVAAAFCDVPEANVTWTEEGLLAYRSVDISIAVATEGGLVTPVLRGVEGMKLSAIARESAALAARARERKLRQHELDGGTFTVSNLGMYGTAEFSAIINPPQSGILAVGAARQQPVVVDGSLAVATVMRCTLSVDHRAIDGALAARWLAAFTARLENPLSTLA
jgi:pyruvate dehydrogenase E2 component (dihydrolipoamide acetyltransferase)